MTVDLMNHIPLTSAYLCQDCDAVGNCATRCPACASGVLLGLAKVFGRQVEDLGSNLFLVTALAA